MRDYARCSFSSDWRIRCQQGAVALAQVPTYAQLDCVPSSNFEPLRHELIMPKSRIGVVARSTARFAQARNRWSVHIVA